MTKKTAAKLSEKECSASLAALEDTLYVIGGKWRLKVIIALREGGVKRFNDLQRTITGISARVLSNELKQLEMNGFVVWLSKQSAIKQELLQSFISLIIYSQNKVVCHLSGLIMITIAVITTFTSSRTVTSAAKTFLP